MNDRIAKIIQQIEMLSSRHDELLTKPLALPETWIHEYEVRRRYLGSGNLETYRYAKWQAKEAIFKRNPKKYGHRGKGKVTKHQHIGRVSSSTGLGTEPQVEEAYESLANRREMESIEQVIAEIEAALAKVMPRKESTT